VRQALGKEINERLLVEVVSGERSNVMEQIKQTSEEAVSTSASRSWTCA
jgi:hypothetical protein